MFGLCSKDLLNAKQINWVNDVALKIMASAIKGRFFVSASISQSFVVRSIGYS